MNSELAHASINFGHGGGIQLPSHHAVERIELIGLRAPHRAALTAC